MSKLITLTLVFVIAILWQNINLLAFWPIGFKNFILLWYQSFLKYHFIHSAYDQKKNACIQIVQPSIILTPSLWEMGYTLGGDEQPLTHIFTPLGNVE